MLITRPLATVTTIAACIGAALAPAVAQRGGFDALRPRELWRVAGAGHGRPAISAGVAYFLSAAHEVIALNAATGARLWSATTAEPGDTLGSTVVVTGSVVIAGDYNLLAFDRYTGAVRWRFVPAVGYGAGIYLGEADRGLVLTGSPAGRVYALRAESGELAWTSALTAHTAVTIFQPRTDGRIVTAGFTVFDAPPVGGVVAFDFATGRELWRTMFPKSVDPLLGTGFASGALIGGDEVIASSGDGSIYGFSRSTGDIRWSIPGLPGVPDMVHGPFPIPDSATSADFRPLVLRGSRLVAGSLKGPVIGYDLRTRRELWRYNDPRSGSSAFGIGADDHTVYVPFYSGHHVAIDMDTGAERWRTDKRDTFTWGAAVDELRVYFSGGGGYVAVARSAGI